MLLFSYIRLYFYFETISTRHFYLFTAILQKNLLNTTLESQIESDSRSNIRQTHWAFSKTQKSWTLKSPYYIWNIRNGIIFPAINGFFCNGRVDEVCTGREEFSQLKLFSFCTVRWWREWGGSELNSNSFCFRGCPISHPKSLLVYSRMRFAKMS